MARRVQRRVAITRVPWRGENVTLRRATRSARAGRGAQVEAAQDRAEHDAHLHLGEGGAEAAADAAAVRDPGVGRRRLVEEALRAERVRLRVGVRAGVGEPDRGRDVGARPGAWTPSATSSVDEPAAGERDDRAQPQRLGDHRAQVLVAAGVERRASTSRVAGQQVERPGERRWRSSRGPASSSVISWSRTSRSLIAEPSSKRAWTSSEQMSRAGRSRARARRSRPAAARRSPRASSPQAARAACGGRSSTDDLQVARDRRAQQVAQQRRAARRGARSETPKTARRITSSVIACMLGWTGERARRRPAVELALGRLAHHRLVRAHPVAVERRQHHLAARRGARRPRAAAATAAPTSGRSVTVPPRRQVVRALGVQRPDRLRARRPSPAAS